MTAYEVLEIYNGLSNENIEVWIDGGWCVDALIGIQTREHSDLDIAVHKKDVGKLRDYLKSRGYVLTAKDGDTDWNFVMNGANGGNIDIHVFEYDAEGKNIYGIEYPLGSFTGKGSINGQIINCISPEWMFKFKTGYTPSKKDLDDVLALSKKFGFQIPSTYQII